MSVHDVAIVGVGWHIAKRLQETLLEARIEAVRAAVADAGLEPHAIDGLVLGEGSESFSERYHMEFAETLGLYDTPLCVTGPMGGAMPGFGLELARWAVASGRCRNVLVVQGRKESDAHVPGRTYTDLHGSLNMHYPDYELPFGPLMVSFYAVLAQRHMYEFGTTEDQLASVPVALRANAALNPDAVYRDPITHDDVADSPLISTPFRKLHCCMINDGAAAFVVSSGEQARSLRQPPVYVRGSGGGQAGYFTGFLAKGGADKGYSLVRTLAKKAADSAFAEAGIGRDEVDLVTMSDSFAIKPIVFLEDYGFCEKGDGGAFVGDGSRIRVGGELPVNPHGGSMSCSHAPTNFLNYIEATLQLRGQAGDRQVEGARIAVAGSGAGVVSTHYVSVLTRD